MDPFKNFSPEVRLLFLLSLRNFKEAVTFSHASPVLFRQCQEHKITILRHYVKKDLDNDLLQDALAITLFPMIYHAESLLRRLWLYIEDYLSKATSQNLPRAYRRLPKWSHEHFSRGFTQIHIGSDVNSFSIDYLTKNERCRILRAFLRYEILCKVYGPVGGELKPRYDQSYKASDEADEYNGYQFDPLDPFRYWDWNVLSKYEDHEPEPRDLQLLPCVREYVLTVYGALIADQIRAEVPQIGENTEFENAPSSCLGRFPDYDPYSQWKDLHRLGGTGWSDTVVSVMASAGFDPLTNTLASSGGDFQNFLLKFNKEVLRSPPLNDATNVNVPISGPSRRSRISWYCNNFIRLHRQKAWALWEENR